MERKREEEILAGGRTSMHKVSNKYSIVEEEEESMKKKKDLEVVVF